MERLLKIIELQTRLDHAKEKVKWLDMKIHSEIDLPLDVALRERKTFEGFRKEKEEWEILVKIYKDQIKYIRNYL